MKYYWIKTSPWIKRLFFNQVWSIPNTENKIYLTFDDGPTPEVTEWVLNVLKKYNIKATFFCIGNNIEKHPEILKETIQEQHVVGNHTFHHKNGWKTSTDEYLKDMAACQSEINNLKSTIPSLFRPPYGKIKPSQSIKLRKLGYKIIMWDILSGDFDNTISPEKCLQNATEKVTSGSIIVFHDSKKSFKNLEFTLPKTIEILLQRGFKFDVIKF